MISMLFHIFHILSFNDSLLFYLNHLTHTIFFERKSIARETKGADNNPVLIGKGDGPFSKNIII